MSNYVKKVQFKLHESYKEPVRILTKPPYEVRDPESNFCNVT